MSVEPSATPDWSEPVRRLEEHGMFLEKRQDELLAAIDDLSRRMDVLMRRVSKLEQGPQGSQPGEKPDNGPNTSGAGTDQSDPGQPA